MPPNNEHESATAVKIPDNEKPTTDESIEDRSHLTIFCTALFAGIVSYVLFLLLYPLILRLIYFLFLSKSPDDAYSDAAMNPLSFGIMMFFG